LPELPEKCPVCGAKVEKGHVSTSGRVGEAINSSLVVGLEHVQKLIDVQTVR